MAMGLKEKGFTFFDLQKNIFNASCFKWLSITFERKKGEKEKNEGECHFKAQDL